MKYKAEQFARVLRQFGIPVHADSRTGYFESMEVRDMLALLSLLDNLRQDVPLAALLRGPLGNLADPENRLARIRVAYPSPLPFHEAVAKYRDEKSDEIASALVAIFNDLGRWRETARRRPLAEVIWTIYQETGYLAYVAGLRNGEQRAENLMHLHQRAAQFGEFQSRGLSRFLKFLEQLQEESDLGQPSVASEADDVVRVMSIHASKGLEFPVVFVPDLGKGINFSDAQGSILADRSAGLGMITVDEERRCRYPSLTSELVQNRLRQQSLAEEMRILYVATTRAREHLILVGTCGEKLPDQWTTRWKEHSGKLPTNEILGARTMLDWLGPVSVITQGLAQDVMRLTIHPAEEVMAWELPGKAFSSLRRRGTGDPQSSAIDSRAAFQRRGARGDRPA